jgi:hypothetical protein
LLLRLLLVVLLLNEFIVAVASAAARAPGSRLLPVLVAKLVVFVRGWSALQFAELLA